MHNQTHEYHLENGFKLIVKEDHRSPIAIFQICYKVGSSYEHNGITGISHALEHMMFTGTTKINSKKFLETFSDCGGQINALTSRDFTTFYELLHADQIEISFSLETDRMKKLLLKERDFNKERQVIMEERRLTIEDNPERVTLEQLFATAFITSSYRYPIIGWMDDIAQLTVEDLVHWYQTWYQPNHAFAVIVGDVKPHQMYRLAKKYFGRLKPTKTLPIKVPKEANQLGRRSVNLSIAARFPYLLLGYKSPVLNIAEESSEQLALLLLCEILAGGNNSVLYNRLVLEKQIALNIGYHYSPFSRLENVCILSVTPKKSDDIEIIKEAIDAAILHIQKKLPSLKDMQRIKTQFLADKIFQDDAISNQAMNIVQFEAIGLSWRDMEKIYNNMIRITPKQVQDVALKYFLEENLTVATLQPLPFNTASLANSLRKTKELKK
jgi:zinc protease